MKGLLNKAVCGALVLGMAVGCPQNMYAQELQTEIEVEALVSAQEVQPDTAVGTDTEQPGTTEDTTQTGTDTEQPDSTQTGTDPEQPDSTQTGTDTEQPGTDTEKPDDTQTGTDTEQPGDDSKQPDEDEEKPDEDEKPEKLPRPAAVKGLRTTKQAKNTVVVAWEESDNAETYIVYRKEKGGDYKKVAKTEDTSYTDKKVGTDKTYTYKILAQNKQKQAKTATKITFSNTKAVHVTSQKYTYSQMKTDLQNLKDRYSDYCELTKIGTSVQGRAIYDFAIGNPNAKESLLVVSTLHAREYICSAVMMKELEYYLENYNGTIGGMTPAKTLKNMQIHYVVMANPDGVTISQTKYARWKANGRGVDLNRNFPSKPFVPGGGKPGAQGYSGKKALSEPESRAVAELTQRLKKEQKLQGVVNYHAMGRIIYGDCSKSSIQKGTSTMYQIAKSLTGYQKAPESGGSGNSYGGMYREYVMDILNLPSITLEIGSSTAPCPYWQYEVEFQKNKFVVMRIAKALQ